MGSGLKDVYVETLKDENLKQDNLANIMLSKM